MNSNQGTQFFYCVDTDTRKDMKIVKIKGMSCQHCVASTTKALEGVEGISGVQVNLEKGEASYEGEVDQQTIKEAIEKIGFEVVE